MKIRKIQQTEQAELTEPMKALVDDILQRMENEKALRNIKRKQRILKHHALVMAFSQYTQMELNRSLIKNNNDWNDAEQTRNFISLFFPDRELKTEQFMYDKNELSNKVLDKYAEYRRWLPVVEFLGIPEKTAEAFCKNVDKSLSIWMLKTLGHLQFPIYFNALFKYLDGTINKAELEKSFVEISIFTGKAEPANLRLFRRAIIETERLIDEIMIKQATRRKMTLEKFKEESRTSNKELAKMLTKTTI